MIKETTDDPEKIQKCIGCSDLMERTWPSELGQGGLD